PDGAQSEVWTDHQRNLLRAADQLLDDHVIDDGTWERLAAQLDERQLLELTFVVGSYACLAMVLNSAGLEPPAGPDLPAGPPRPRQRAPPVITPKEADHAAFPQTS